MSNFKKLLLILAIVIFWLWTATLIPISNHQYTTKYYLLHFRVIFDNVLKNYQKQIK